MVGKDPWLYVFPGRQNSFVTPHSHWARRKLRGPNRHTILPHQDTFQVFLGSLLSAQMLQTMSDVLLGLFYYCVTFVVLRIDSEPYECWESAICHRATPLAQHQTFNGSHTGLFTLKQSLNSSPLHTPAHTRLEAALNVLDYPDPPYLMQA